MRNGYMAASAFLLCPILPEGYAEFQKPHLGQCSACAHRIVTELPFGNGTRGEVHLCESKRKELGIEDEERATRRRCKAYTPKAGANAAPSAAPGVGAD